ncbi:cupin domain-containing protein [Cryomorphaceae bacterium 1068]|nr:cupin domain-containing protein [Cryomorphaceae bacterium 1068]
MPQSIQDLVNQLHLLPHPEGGYYRETYRSDLSHLPPNALGIEEERNISTAIYFLLTGGNFSAFHRIKQDELWHHYMGDAIAVHTISPEGEYQKLLLGKDLAKGELPQHLVKGGTWFASESLGEYSLAGCTVAPGFDFADFELPPQEELLDLFPQHCSEIERLTRE